MKSNLKNLSAWMIYFDSRYEAAASAAARLSAYVFPADAPREALAAVREYLEAHGYPPEIALSVRSAFDFIGERNRRDKIPPHAYRALVYLSHDDSSPMDGASWLAFFERDDFHCHVPRAAARRVFGTILHNVGDIDFKLLNELCLNYGCAGGDFFIIRDDPGLPGIGDLHYLLRHLDMNPENYENVIYALKDADINWLYARHRDNIHRWVDLNAIDILEQSDYRLDELLDAPHLTRQRLVCHWACDLVQRHFSEQGYIRPYTAKCRLLRVPNVTKARQKFEAEKPGASRAFFVRNSLTAKGEATIFTNKVGEPKTQQNRNL